MDQHAAVPGQAANVGCKLERRGSACWMCQRVAVRHDDQHERDMCGATFLDQLHERGNVGWPAPLRRERRAVHRATEPRPQPAGDGRVLGRRAHGVRRGAEMLQHPRRGRPLPGRLRCALGGQHGSRSVQERDGRAAAQWAIELVKIVAWKDVIDHHIRPKQRLPSSKSEQRRVHACPWHADGHVAGARRRGVEPTDDRVGGGHRHAMDHGITEMEHLAATRPQAIGGELRHGGAGFSVGQEQATRVILPLPRPRGCIRDVGVGSMERRMSQRRLPWRRG